MWEIEFTHEFGQWWEGLSEADQDALARGVELLRQVGPALGRPHVDGVKGSKYPNMKELRTQSGGRPLRTFFAFDPRRSAILLIGGDKTGDSRFCERMIPLADALYETHLEELRKEGLIWWQGATTGTTSSTACPPTVVPASNAACART